MKLTFLGVSSALSEGFNSNMLLDTDQGKTLLMDCGVDIKYSLKAANRQISEIDAVYISHLHGDHCGSLEWLGYYFYFVLKRKIDLYIHESLLSDLWMMLSPSMSIHKNKNLILQDYFNIKTFDDRAMSFNFDDCMFRSYKSLHINGKYQNMYSYSLLVDNQDTSDKNEGLFYISFDTEEINMIDARHIFYDCDVMNLSGVHVNYNHLKNIQDETRKKMWLYHYSDLSKYNGKYGEMPNAEEDGFAGFIKEGQIFDFLCEDIRHGT